MFTGIQVYGDVSTTEAEPAAHGTARDESFMSRNSGSCSALACTFSLAACLFVSQTLNTMTKPALPKPPLAEMFVGKVSAIDLPSNVRIHLYPNEKAGLWSTAVAVLTLTLYVVRAGNVNVGKRLQYLPHISMSTDHRRSGKRSLRGLRCYHDIVACKWMCAGVARLSQRSLGVADGCRTVDSY